MTGRTHDLAAFAALTYVTGLYPPQNLRLSTALVALTANFVGGLCPDLDQPTAGLWHRIPAGSLWGRLLAPLLGGHRFISHSILGLFLFGIASKYLLGLASHVLLVDMNLVWWAFMIGCFSHLVMDSFTRDGVPWLFPLPWKLGFPPLRFMRVRTGSWFEKYVVFPGILVLTGYLFYLHYYEFLALFKIHLNS